MGSVRWADEIIDGVTVHHRHVRGDGVDLHVAIAGDGPPVILLHGFPENWRSWRKQIRTLVGAGLSVWMPDMRGYNWSARPSSREAYHLRHLVADLAALVCATGVPRAHVCGHDWGGIVAWTFAGHHPEQVDRLVICNAPHLRLYAERVRRPPQLIMSWYVLFFQLPRLPELVLSLRDFRAVRAMFAADARGRRCIHDGGGRRLRARALRARRAHGRAGLLPRQSGSPGCGAWAVGGGPSEDARAVGRARSGIVCGTAGRAGACGATRDTYVDFRTSDTGSRTKRQAR